MAVSDHLAPKGRSNRAAEPKTSVTPEYEYGKAYPLTDGWEPGPRFTGEDGVVRYIRRVTKAEHDEHKPDGHRADGSPWWSHIPVRRVKASAWEASSDIAESRTPPADDVREALIAETRAFLAKRPMGPAIYRRMSKLVDALAEVRPRGTVTDAVVVDMLTAFYGEERDGWSMSKVRRMRAALEAARSVAP